MKATGIVRRIDDLGRVVIPKEIRRTMRIREGDPLEIYTDREGEVIFKKYSPIGEMTGFAAQYAETLYKTIEIMWHQPRVLPSVAFAVVIFAMSRTERTVFLSEFSIAVLAADEAQ